MGPTAEQAVTTETPPAAGTEAAAPTQSRWGARFERWAEQINKVVMVPTSLLCDVLKEQHFLFVDPRHPIESVKALIDNPAAEVPDFVKTRTAKIGAGKTATDQVKNGLAAAAAGAAWIFGGLFATVLAAEVAVINGLVWAAAMGGAGVGVWAIEAKERGEERRLAKEAAGTPGTPAGPASVEAVADTPAPVAAAPTVTTPSGPPQPRMVVARPPARAVDRGDIGF